ncbi:MAG: glycosyltransferase family 2 protein [Pirellulaceae bacterium]|jgi:glycosyltransferase involved in cell wall biosynthesis
MEIAFVVATYRRPEVLAVCLEAICNQELPEGTSIQVRVYDNGSPKSAESTVRPWAESHGVVYINNGVGHGLGYSLTRGARESQGDVVVEMNDDAIIPQGFVARVADAFGNQPRLGILGFRADEDGYQEVPGGIGQIDGPGMRLIGNFCRPTSGPIAVEHVYGFCYAWRRAILDEGLGHDPTLLTKDFSNGSRLDTDHSLTVLRGGWQVIYDGSLPVRHLAMPRGDMSEVSTRWRINDIRNTLYLYLKHFGLFGRSALALRYGLLFNHGILSALRQPTRANWVFFLAGLRGRASAVRFYVQHLLGG